MAISFMTITLLGKVYELRFGLGASVRYEQLTGKKIVDYDEGSMLDAAQVLWAMLSYKIPDITFDEAMEMFDNSFDSVSEITEKINKAIIVAYSGGKVPNVKAPTAKS